ncbi:copper resistance protein CopC [Ornithinimicrobium sp. F0845]|uniref:copper resistance CopC family protein n=1 Tax=Ornithinimicrobium sp. F0845 TaxID=2926412 RepID=UPI001FF6A33B|nr:copper resistance CopC family protein [Ornithinimicrobium sp. F0845]MCK0112632.1 copper resistance protein CopC [Ornithinimicrobium sp. F0845]
MHTRSRRAVTRPVPSIPHLILGALAALLAGAVLLGTGSAASAHDTLTDSSPTDGETLDEPPTQVRLTFSGEVLDMGAAVVVTDSDGASWEAGEPTVDGVDVTVPVQEGLPNGSYEVTWRVTSSDGHPISGVIPFTVDAPEPEPAEPTTTEPAPTTAAQETAEQTTEPATEPAETDPAPTTANSAAAEVADDEADESSGGFPWLPVVIGVVLAALAYVVVRVLRRGAPEQGGDQ